MRILLIILALLLPRAALAGKSVGVLVSGGYLEAPAQQQAEKWLRAHAQTVVSKPLPADAVSTLLNCFVLDDPKCMRSVIDARSTTDLLVSIRVDLTSKRQREVRVTVDWFAKGHSPVSARRNCDECTEPALRTTIDAMLEDLARTAPGFTGTLRVLSDPPGLTVLLDNRAIGVTPLERSVPIGEHTLKLVSDGRTGPARSLTIESGQLFEAELEAPAAGRVLDDESASPATSRSRLVPGLMIGIGLAGVGAGTALYLTSEEPTGQNRTYRDTKNLGIGVAAGGGALLITGVIIILATGSSSGPTVSMTPGGGASVGWVGSF